MCEGTIKARKHVYSDTQFMQNINHKFITS